MSDFNTRPLKVAVIKEVYQEIDVPNDQGIPDVASYAINEAKKNISNLDWKDIPTPVGQLHGDKWNVVPFTVIQQGQLDYHTYTNNLPENKRIVRRNRGMDGTSTFILNGTLTVGTSAAATVYPEDVNGTNAALPDATPVPSGVVAGSNTNPWKKKKKK